MLPVEKMGEVRFLCCCQAPIEIDYRDKVKNTKELIISGYKITFSIAENTDKLELEDLIEEYLYRKIIKI